jgi:hypothetical protein
MKALAAYLGVCLAIFSLPSAVRAQVLPKTTSAVTQTPKNDESQKQTDRLQILQTERENIIKSKANWERNGDKAVLARIEADLQAINREIEHVNKAPTIKAIQAPITPKQTVAKPAFATPVANTEPMQEKTDIAVHEAWDIFKNFGRKGSNQ